MDTYCVKIEFFSGGSVFVDVNDSTCNNPSFNLRLGSYDSASFNTVTYTDNSTEGSVSVIEQVSSTELSGKLDIKSLSAAVYDILLIYPKCYIAPSSMPSSKPTSIPSLIPSSSPSVVPSSVPSLMSSFQPSLEPSGVPNGVPMVGHRQQPLHDGCDSVHI